MSDDDDRKVDIDWVKTTAGALAAVSSAVLLSTLGAAGTLIGAALGSVVATVGGALYTQGLATSREQLARAQEAARVKVGVAQSELRRASRQQNDTVADAHLALAEERLDDARDELDTLDEEPAGLSWQDRLKVLPWRRISLVAAGLFAAAVVTITAFELATGDSVSEITGGTEEGGGTTISRIGGGGADEEGSEDEVPADEQEPPADDPAEDPSAEPSDEPTPESSPTSSVEPTPEPTLPSEDTEPSAPLPSASTG